MTKYRENKEKKRYCKLFQKSMRSLRIKLSKMTQLYKAGIFFKVVTKREKAILKYLKVGDFLNKNRGVG